ncbi:MAG: ribosome maturation factor RimM [bacterium]
MENYVNIGSLVATFGIKGEMVLKHHLGQSASLTGIKAVFIETSLGKFMPYFISSAKEKNAEEILIGFEGIESPEKAKSLLRKKVWLKEEDVKKTASSNAAISLLGFQIYDKKKLLGKVLEVIEQPVQILLRIEIDKKEVLVPINESTLIGIDHKKEKIDVDLPDGLLDIYLT